MGYYIETPNHTNKALQLYRLHNAQVIERPKTFTQVPQDQALICVIENPLFDACLVCYCEREFVEAMQKDGRSRTWLLLPWEKVAKLIGIDPRV